MRMSRALALLACFCLLVPVTACGNPAGQRLDNEYLGAYLYGPDGAMSNPFGEQFGDKPGLLAGMKGTRAQTRLSVDFIARLHALDPNLTDYIYAGEGYDAVVIAALAAEVAGTTDPKTIAKYINGVTIGDQPCHDVPTCLAVAGSGGDVAYRGITVTSGFTEAGEPSTTSYSTVHFGPSNQLDEGKTEFLRLGDETTVATTAPPKPGAGRSGAPLVLGQLLTVQSVLTHASIAGAKLALQDLNAAGGVLGAQIVWKDGDDGGKADVAKAQLAKHKTDGVHVLIGPSFSTVASEVIPEAVKQGLVMISPSATAASLSTLPDEGLFFRTGPSDALQSHALADMIVRDGPRKVTLIARNDPYGTGLAEDVRKKLLAAGMTEGNIQMLSYEVDGEKVKDDSEIANLAEQTIRFKPTGVLVVGLAESADVIKALADADLQIRR